MQHQIVSREQRLTARKALLAKERAMAHALDAFRAGCRQLPWVRIDLPPKGRNETGGTMNRVRLYDEY
jgi:predicted dithiol-disulfide oxidoreductase (DUF899 family)